MSSQIIEILKVLIKSPNLASKKWICQQYDSQVMNDTISIRSDAAIVRVRGGAKNKALAMSTDCTPRYVEANPYEGAIQAVAETYRNISAVGAKPLAITNCLNFGNPQKPEIMGQIVKAIKGITEASKALNYPVISGNVSLYNETNSKAIKPTPAIGGVGLLQDLTKRSGLKFNYLNDEIYVIGKNEGHVNCSIFEQEFLQIKESKNPPKVNLKDEKNHSEFVRELIEKQIINSCHDISDGGLMVALFEMSSKNLGCNLNFSELEKDCGQENLINTLFGEDQSRYIISVNKALVYNLKNLADKKQIKITKLGEVCKEKMIISSGEVEIKELIRINESVFESKFA